MSELEGSESLGDEDSWSEEEIQENSDEGWLEPDDAEFQKWHKQNYTQLLDAFSIINSFCQIGPVGQFNYNLDKFSKMIFRKHSEYNNVVHLARTALSERWRVDTPNQK